MGSVSGSIAASSRAGTTATTPGQRAGSAGWSGPGSRTSVRQYPPCPASRYTQTAAAATQAATRITTPAAWHKNGVAPRPGG